MIILVNANECNLAYFSPNNVNLCFFPASLLSNPKNIQAPDQIITEQALFRLVPPTLSFIEITTRTTVTSASRRVPNYPVELWNDFLEEAFNASNSINAIDRKFIDHNLVPHRVGSEESTVDLFLEVIGNVN